MKRIFLIALALIIAAVPVIVSTAQPRYNADFSFVVTLNGKRVDASKQIYVYNGDNIGASLHLKTGEDYFAGPLATEIFYTGCFTYNNFNWNTSGRYYSCCKSYTNLKKNDNNFKLDMIPTSVDCKAAVDNINEGLLTLSFTAKGKRGDEASLYLDSDTVRSTANPFGETYLACYTDNGNLAGERYDYGEGMVLNMDKAQVKFVVTNAGDVNADGKINSADALDILQHVTSIKPLNTLMLKVADVDYNGKVNASDSLAVLQMTTGVVNINDIINR